MIDVDRVRSVYERAYRSLREDQPDAKEEAVMLLEAWRNMERRAAAAANIPGDRLRRTQGLSSFQEMLWGGV